MMSQPSHWQLFYKRPHWHAKNGKRNGISGCGWDWSFYWICAGISRYCHCGIQPIHRARTEIKERCASANHQRVQLAQPDGLALSIYILRTKVTEDAFTKWDSDKAHEAILRMAFMHSLSAESIRLPQWASYTGSTVHSSAQQQCAVGQDPLPLMWIEGILVNGPTDCHRSFFWPVAASEDLNFVWLGVEHFLFSGSYVCVRVFV